MMGCGLFIEHAFSCWPFHKLYLDVAGYNLGRFRSGEGTLFEVEGRLRGHHFQGGRRWDHHILAIFRESWEPYWRRHSAAVLGGAPERELVGAPG
jgi:RimJ/RimL family protein N-acetyltransferase